MTTYACSRLDMPSVPAVAWHHTSQPDHQTTAMNYNTAPTCRWPTAAHDGHWK